MASSIQAVLRSRLAIAATGGALSLAAAFVAYFEGYKPTPYVDPVGILTVCYGTTHNIENRTYTKAECDKLLTKDLANAYDAIARNVTVPLPDKTRAAYASFIYNVGESKFKSSTLLKQINAGYGARACDQLLRWTYAGGRQLKGLVKRRQAEWQLCVEGYSEA